jgi:hypothetical protein
MFLDDLDVGDVAWNFLLLLLLDIVGALVPLAML